VKPCALKSGLLMAETPAQRHSAIRRLGYLPLSEKDAAEGLRGIASRTDPRNLMLDVGKAIARDPEGLWPSSAFARAFMDLKKEAAQGMLCDEGIDNQDTLLLMSLSRPESADPDSRRRIEAVAAENGYTHLGLPSGFKAGAGNFFRSAQMVASYLGRSPGLPWKEDDEGALRDIILNALSVEWNYEMVRHFRLDSWREKSMERPGEDMIYHWAAPFDKDHGFRNAAHIGWKVMPGHAMRPSIDILRSEDHLGKRREVSGMLAKIVSRGHHISVKFTKWLASYRAGETSGLRYCIYVPTCALGTTLAAYKEAGLPSGRFLEMAKEGFRPPIKFLLDGDAELRQSGEESLLSRAQKEDTVRAIRAAGIGHRDLCGDETHLYKRSIALGEGRDVVLWECGSVGGG